VALLLVLAAAGAFAGWRLSRPRGPTPPAVPTTGVRPEVAEAISGARQKVVETPKSADAWGHLGLVFTAHGFDDQAAACYRESHRLDPADDRWPYLLALYYLADDRDPAAALGLLEAALACPHKDARKEAAVRLRLAEVYLGELRPADAERLFREHLAREPHDPRGAVGLGATLLAADRPAEAVEFLRAGADGPFTRRRAVTNLAVASRLLGRPDDAARYDRQAAALPEDVPPPDPFAAEAAALRADGRGGFEEVIALEKEGRVRETLPLLARLAEDPADVRAAVALGQNLSLLGEFAAAEPYLRAACARDPENAQAAFLLGTVLFDLARTQTGERKERLLRDSADASARAAKLNPNLGMAHLSRGAALRELGDLPGALACFRRAAEGRPEVPQVQLALLQSLADAGLLDEARARLPVAEKVVPADDPRLAEIRKRLTSPKP
jgi:tetratricopeptide (TPR) repeat protein